MQRRSDRPSLRPSLAKGIGAGGIAIILFVIASLFATLVVLDVSRQQAPAVPNDAPGTAVSGVEPPIDLAGTDDLGTRGPIVEPLAACPLTPPSYPSSAWDRVWCDSNFSNTLTDTPDESVEMFDNNWGQGLVGGIQADNIGFRSGRTISIAALGTYTFSVGSDDGVRVWIDGATVLDRWVDRAFAVDTFSRTLAAGAHTVRIDYYEHGLDARVSFSYVAPGNPNIYHVAITGSDGNGGSESAPWRTIGRASQAVRAGDTVVVHAGTYDEQVTIAPSGTSASPILFYTTPSDRATVSGRSLTLGRYVPLVHLAGAYVEFRGFEIADAEVDRSGTTSDSKGICVRLSGDYVVARDNDIHGCYDHGVEVQKGTGARIVGNTVRDTNLVVLRDPSTWWGSAITTASDPFKFPNSRDVEIVNNTVYASYGEGITPWLAQNVLIKGNTVYNIRRPAIYLNEAKDVRAEANYVRCDPADGPGILVATERGTVVVTTNVTVVNNFVFGCVDGIGFAHWPGTTIDGMNDVVLAYNTVVNAGYRGIWIGGVLHPGSSVRDNVVYQGNGKATFGGDVTGLTLGPNCWYGPDPGPAHMPNDIFADPKLVNPSGNTPADAKLQPTSPCIDKAIVLEPLWDGVVDDYFATLRGSSPDVGAHEQNGGSTSPQCPASPPSYSAVMWDRVWCDSSFTTKLANTPDQTGVQFDDDWGAGLVGGIQASDIGFRSGRTINLLGSGDYTFSVGSDDGVRVWIDGTMVLDKWVGHSYAVDTFTRTLLAGDHQFRIDYYEGTSNGDGGDARVSFSYTAPTSTAPCPPAPPSYPTSTWDRVWCDASFTTKLADTPDENVVMFDNDWGQGVVGGIQADNIGFRSGRTINLAVSGDYSFSVGSDDGIRVWIDGTVVLDRWLDRGYTVDTFTRTLSSGDHQFRIDFYENGYSARVSFGYTPPSSGSCPSSPPSYPTSMWDRVWCDASFATKLADAPDQTSLQFDENWGRGKVGGIRQNNIGFRSGITIDILGSASYKFTVGADDGVRLWIDGTLVLDEWRQQSYKTFTVTRQLSIGNHEIRLDYFESQGSARVSFSYAQTSSGGPGPSTLSDLPPLSLVGLGAIGLGGCIALLRLERRRGLPIR